MLLLKKVHRGIVHSTMYIVHTKKVHTRFVNKTLCKEIMKRLNLRNKYLKSSREEDSQRFGKQTNLCVSLLGNTKRSYSNLNKERVMRKL